VSTDKKDVVINGGGLAGLTLAHQLKMEKPELDILVVEKGRFPKPEKTAKVGESTVEIGSHYLTHTLDLKDHFNDRHLRKHGLRCFFGAPQADFSAQDELGVSELFGIPAYQIDRGAIENYLYDLAVSNGVEVVDGASTDNLTINDSERAISIKNDNGGRKVSARWLVDAAGRQALIKNKLGLQKPSKHNGNAIWFRIDRQVKLDDWSANALWQKRVKQPNTRWLSTNHLMGPGYWVWVIPLDNGATSIGVVMDDQAMATHDFSSYETTFAWLVEHHPRCAQAIEGADVLDYVVIKNYSLACKQSFSEQGWALTGESGVFADPFYSPGSDFIALHNSFITKLISKDIGGKDIRLDSRVYQTINQSFFDSTLSLYTGQYGGFGDRRMMSLKLVWDYAYYWGVLSLLFFRSAMTDIALMRHLNPVLTTAYDLNAQVQGLFRKRASKRRVLPAQGVFMDQYQIPCLRHFNKILQSDLSTDIEVTLGDNVKILQRLAVYMQEMLQDEANLTISPDEQDILGDYRHSVLA